MLVTLGDQRVFTKWCKKLSWICSQKWIVFLEETVNSKEQIIYVGVNIWACFLPNEDCCVYYSSNTYSDVLNKMFINCFWFEWILTIKSNFLSEQKWKKRKTNWKPAIMRDQSRALSLERRTACAKFAERNCCWEFSLSKQTIWIKCNFFLLKVFKYEVSSGDLTSQPVWLIFYFQWLRATLILVTDIEASLL